MSSKIKSIKAIARGALKDIGKLPTIRTDARQLNDPSRARAVKAQKRQDAAIKSIARSAARAIALIPTPTPVRDTSAARSALAEKRRLEAETRAKRTVAAGSARAVRSATPTIMPSSNVSGYGYDETTQILRVWFHGGSQYEYSTVTLSEWIHLSAGDATCKTTGQNEYGRWWKGKSPSIGAAIWKYLRRTGKPYKRIS